MRLDNTKIKNTGGGPIDEYNWVHWKEKEEVQHSFVNLIQAKVISEEGTLIKKMPPEDRAVGKSAGL